MRFIFKAKDRRGLVKEGVVEAYSKDTAVQALQSKELVPIFVVEEDTGSSITKDLKRIWEGVSKKELVVFFRELSALIEAKVPIVSSLQAISNQSTNIYLKAVIKELSDDIEDGMSLSESMAKHPTVFENLIISMVRAGEASGNLQKSITFIADNIEKNFQLNAKIKSALFYPIFVIGAAIIIGFVMVTFILPKLTVMIKEMNAAIPWYTSVVIWLGDFMSAYWWAILIVILGAIGGMVYYIKSEDGRKEWDQMKIKLPIVGKLFRAIYIARFSDNFAALLAGGIPVVRALVLVSDVVNNDVYKKIILKASEEVKIGGNISSVFAKYEEIPPIVTQMMSIGEETGKTSEILHNVSYFYEQEVDNTTRALTSLLEPVLITVLGIGVAFLVFSILLPLYNVVGNLN